MVREYAEGMEKNTRPDDPEQPHPAPDGPLTQLIEHQSGEPGPGADESRFPQPTPASRQGREDYASGTPEHEDDRDL